MSANKTNILPILFWLLLLIMLGCKNNPHNVDVADIETNISFYHFEKDILSIDTANIVDEFTQLEKKYPEFFPAYYTEIVNLDNYDSSIAPQIFKEFITFKPTVELNETIQNQFGDTKKYDKEIEEAFKHYKYHFPNDSLPDIIYFAGILRYGTINFGDKIAIGLDMYLDDAYPYNSILDLSSFLTLKMKPEYISRNVMAVLAEDRFKRFDRGKRFIDKMIYEGKTAYYLNAMQPEKPDSIILGMTGKDVKWCEKNEWQIWQHIVDPKLKVLYSTEQDIVSRYFEEGPFTNAPNVPPDSSPRFVVWTGREIIEKYMKNNSDISLAELMQETNSDKILKESKYKP